MKSKKEEFLAAIDLESYVSFDKREGQLASLRKLEKQFIQFFAKIYGRDLLGISDSDLQRIKEKFMGASFLFGDNESALRFSTTEAAYYLEKIKAFEAMILYLVANELWFDGIKYRKNQASKFFSPMRKSLRQLQTPISFLEQYTKRFRSGGRPKDRNLNGIIRGLANFFYSELGISKINKIGDFSLLNENLDTTQYMRPVDRAVVVLISNFLEATGIRPNIRLRAIRRIVKSAEKLKR